MSWDWDDLLDGLYVSRSLLDQTYVLALTGYGPSTLITEVTVEL